MSISLSKSFLFSVCLTVSTFVLSHAQTKTAINNGNWNSAGTWSPSGVPGDNDIILIPSERTVTVLGTDHTLNNAILIIVGRLIMESTCWICTNYGSLTFTGEDSGVIIEEGAQVTDGTALGGDTHFISVLGETVWSGDNCSSNCGTVTGNYTSTGGATVMPEGLSNPLPVEMIYFSGVYKNESVYLEWATASEINNSHFEVERAVDGFDFTKIGEVSGAGNSTHQIKYTFEDNSSVKGSMLYYRLKQVDYDGQHEYSNTVAVFNESPGILNIWPTPFIDQITITLNGSFSENIHVKLYDIKGQQYFSQSYDIIRGSNTLEISSLIDLHSGIYFLDLSSNSFQHREKVIKQ